MSTVVGIHPIHRRMAEIWEMNMDVKGTVIVDAVLMQQLIPLLRQNYLLTRRFDELRQLAFMAHVKKDQEWLYQITAQINELEMMMEF